MPANEPALRARSSTVVTRAALDAEATDGASSDAASMETARRKRRRTGDSRVAAPRSFAGKSFDPPQIESLHRCQAAPCGDFCSSRSLSARSRRRRAFSQQNDAPRVLAVHLDNDINPVTQEYVENEVDRAENDGYSAMVLVLDTPGGLGSSMRGIVKRFLASKVPVVVYVAPSGSSADSAGAVITMASDLAAMAPQTNIGSSTPISLNGQDISKDLRRKIVNDAAAYVGELAREHDRNVVAARKMVTVASNYGAREAKRIGLVEVIAPTLPVLLNEIDGTKTVPKGLVLHTAGAQIDDVEMSFWQRARDFLVDPNLIALMLSIGLIGIVVELWNPGLIFPGTVGAISLILGLYGLQILPVSARRAAPDASRRGLLRGRRVPTRPTAPPRGRCDPLRARRADALRSCRGRVPGVASGRGRDRRDARAPARLRTHPRPACSAQPGRGRTQGLVGEEGVVRREGLVQVNGELWQAHTENGSPLSPGDHVRVERVEEGLQLVVGSPVSPNEEEAR